jgi:hypothetical protein
MSTNDPTGADRKHSMGRVVRENRLFFLAAIFVLFILIIAAAPVSPPQPTSVPVAQPTP